MEKQLAPASRRVERGTYTRSRESFRRVPAERPPLLAGRFLRIAAELIAFGELNFALDAVGWGELFRGVIYADCDEAERAERSLRRSFAVFERSGDPAAGARALTHLASMVVPVEDNSARWRGMLREAARLVEERVDSHEASGARGDRSPRAKSGVGSTKFLEERLQALRDLERAAGAAEARIARRVGNELLSFGHLNQAPSVAAWGAYARGIAAAFEEDGRSAEQSFLYARAVFSATGDIPSAEQAASMLSALSVDERTSVFDARPANDRYLPSPERDAKALAIMRGYLAEVSRQEGDVDGALRNGRDALRLFCDIGERVLAAWQLVNLAHYQALKGDFSAAARYLAEAGRDLDFERPRYVAWYFDVWIIIATNLSRWEEAARLLGFVGAYGAQHLSGDPVEPWTVSPLQLGTLLASACENVGDLLSEGAAMTIAQARDLAASLNRIAR